MGFPENATPYFLAIITKIHSLPLLIILIL